MSREEWEKKFCGHWIKYHTWIGSRCVRFLGWHDRFGDVFLSVDKHGVKSNWVGLYNWIIVEPYEPKIEEKSIEDFPLVEVRYNNGRWKKKRYVHSESIGFVCIGLSGHTTSVWDEMRPIKTVSAEQLKVNAYLGVR